MTSSHAVDLINGLGLEPLGPVRWGSAVTCPDPGVYVIETPSPLLSAPIDEHVVRAWINRVASLKVDGERPTSAALSRRLASFWIPGETVVYVGLAGSSVAKRVGQFYRTSLGDRRPHAGGHWLKTLSVLDELLVWWATTSNPAATEADLLRAFAHRHGGGLVLPFANRQTAGGVRKAHGITKSTLSAGIAPSVRRPAASIPRGGATSDRLAKINTALQRFACSGPDAEVTAVEGARELDRIGLLRDSPIHRGLPLRNLLRDGKIDHAYQDSSLRWFIRCGAER